MKQCILSSVDTIYIQNETMEQKEIKSVENRLNEVNIKKEH